MSRPRVLALAAGRGAAAGIVGTAVMTAAEHLEQRVTRRPSSYVPGRTLLTLLGQRPSDAEKPIGWNHAMHWSTGALVGALRGLWSVTGIRGAQAGVLHAAVRLAFDQTLENATGAGAPPATWPPLERAVDLGHKALWAAVTGVVADRLIEPSAVSRRGVTSH